MTQVCTHFQKGSCKFGNKCINSHETSTNVVERPIPENQSVTRKLCKFHQEGICKNGENCEFTHQKPSNAIEHIQPRNNFRIENKEFKQPRNNFQTENKEFKQAYSHNEICKNHIKGKCHKGNSCKYSHEISSSTSNNSQNLQFPKPKPKPKQNQPLLKRYRQISITFFLY